MSSSWQDTRAWLVSWWDRLTAPHPTITIESDRRSARLLATLALMGLAAMLVGVLIGALVARSPLVLALALTGIPLTGLVYVLSRSRRPRNGVVFFTIANLVWIAAALWIMPEPVYGITIMIIPVVMASLFWPTRVTALVALAALALTLILVQPAPDQTSLFLAELLFMGVPVMAVLINSMLRQISERRLERRTDELMASEVRFHELLDSTPVEIWEEDFSDMLRFFDELRERGVQDLEAYFRANPEEIDRCMARVRVLDVNQHTLQVHRMPDKEELLRQMTHIVNPANREAYLPQLLATAARLSEYEGESTHYTITGERMDMNIRWKVMRGHEHDMSRVIVAITDTSARRQMERHQMELELERERVRMLQRFLGDTSHDLMTPITIMRNSVYLLDRTPITDRQEARLQGLQVQLNRLEKMIKDMLMMSRLDAPAGDEFRFTRTDLNGLISRLVNEHQPSALNQQHQIAFAPARNMPLVEMDAEKLMRAFSNLLDNALKFTPAGGRVTVQTSFGNGEARVEVQDNGPGIPSEDLPHIFDRFYRGEQHRPGSGGSGLGLAIAHKIVTAHGGTITVESIPGQSTTFLVRLPLRANQSFAHEPATNHDQSRVG